MKNYLLTLAIIFAGNLFLNAKVTYTVKVPEGTNACFIAGEMSSWGQIEMNKSDGETYTLTLENATLSQKYKYCSGPNWTYVERAINGMDIPDRLFHEKDTVASWATVWIPPTVPVTYTVKVPKGTNACYIAGEMNGWSQVKMNRVNDETYVLTIENASISNRYKYCSGPDWRYVERDLNGLDIADRSYQEKDTVASWALVWSPPSTNDGPAVPSGKIKRYAFVSNYVQNRTVDVWLPDGYSEKKKYAVLYMQDGQNLFDGPSNAFNGQEWKADETATLLLQQKKIKDVIIVGPWNTNNRYAEYFPEKAFEYMPESVRRPKINEMAGDPEADDYLKFMVEELKPFIDSTFSTYTDQPHTFVAGSSMGGLISMYAICEYPNIFAAAGCLSTHWANNSLDDPAIPDGLRRYMIDHLPSPVNHKFYFDRGTVGLDANYPTHQSKVDTIMNFKGYDDSNWITKVYQNHDHNEYWWSSRFDVPLLFLLGTEPYVNSAPQFSAHKLVNIFPNPSKNRLFLQGLNDEKSHSISIYNLSGIKQNISISINKKEIDISNLPLGIFLIIIDGKTQKFVKQ
jgi:predicted alpha/beta superfamily hydrolase